MPTKSLLKKISLIALILVFLFNINFSVVRAQDDNNAGEQAIQSLQNLSNNQTGLIGCDPYSSNSQEACSPKKAFSMVGKLVQVAIYLVVISVVLMIVIGGIGVAYSSNKAATLNKWKKMLRRAVVALLILIGGVTLVLGFLAALGLKTEVLEVLKGLFASNNFNFFSHAIAQDSISQAADQVASSSGNTYVNFFSGQTVGSLILTIFKVLIRYIAAPALVIAVILSGFNFVKAQGNPEKLQKAKKFALYVVLGIVVTALAQVVISVMLNTIQDIKTKTDASISQSTSLEVWLSRDYVSYQLAKKSDL